MRLSSIAAVRTPLTAAVGAGWLVDLCAPLALVGSQRVLESITTAGCSFKVENVIHGGVSAIRLADPLIADPIPHEKLFDSGAGLPQRPFSLPSSLAP